MKRITLAAAGAAAFAGGCVTEPAPSLDDPASIQRYLEAQRGSIGASDFHGHLGNIGPDSLGRPTNFGKFTTPRPSGI